MSVRDILEVKGTQVETIGPRATVIDAFGALTVLVNKAGIAEGASLADTTLDSYRRVIDVNQIGVFLGMKAAIDPMTAAGGGSILRYDQGRYQVGPQGWVCSTTPLRQNPRRSQNLRPVADGGDRLEMIDAPRGHLVDDR